jgi:nicotinate-nucleotide adenylyltransferase
MTRPTTLALFGGSFNPPHLGHEMVCLYVLETGVVDRVLVVPTWQHAFDKHLADFDDRFEMCRRAMALFGDRVQVSRVEEELGGESRTWRTLERLRAQQPAAAWRLVIGSDILAETDAWQRWDDIVQIAPPIVVGRGDHRKDTTVPIGMPDFSSTQARALLARGEDAVGLVSRSVMDYIAERGLYR